MADIVVIGSLNMDLSVHVSRLPIPGETISGGALVTSAGGKGANQAAACARLGADVAMAGRVGDDDFGRNIVDGLSAFGVDVSRVTTIPSAPTGTAVILVDSGGENCIVLSPGANGLVSLDADPAIEEMIRSARMLLLQMEIPLEAVCRATDTAHRYGVPVLLNPAPAADIPAATYPKIDYLVPNEIEAAILSGIEVRDMASAEQAAARLREKGAGVVIVTLGDQGAFVDSAEFSGHVPSIQITPVDTTAAGDAFIGGFAAARMNGHALADSVRFACCAGALAATKPGAQVSLPSYEEVQSVFSSQEVEYK